MIQFSKKKKMSNNFNYQLTHDCTVLIRTARQTVEGKKNIKHKK